MSRRAHSIVYDPIVADHLECIERKYHPLLRRKIWKQLRNEPMAVTKNRKPLTGPLAIGEDLREIRFDPDNRFRIFYDVDAASRTVVIRAAGEKKGNRLWIGGKEIKL